jgi:hypothetical protein
LLLTLAPLPALGQVLRCTEMMQPIADDLLKRAVDELKVKSPGIRFQADDQPCVHARATVAALRKTLDRNYLSTVLAYEYVRIVNGDGYFTIERFKSDNPKDLAGLETALNRNQSRRLKIEANTSYEFFMDHGGIVLMISSAAGKEQNAALFRQVRSFFARPLANRPGAG